MAVIARVYQIHLISVEQCKATVPPTLRPSKLTWP